MKITKYAQAKWNGGLKDGKGTITTESGALQSRPYGFNTRFENAKGTNPEELIGAAHAGCFTMALAKILEEAHFKADQLETRAQVTLEKVGEDFEITHIKLNLKARVPNCSREKFQELAYKAKENCPVSKLFQTKINLEATLDPQVRIKAA